MDKYKELISNTNSSDYIICKKIDSEDNSFVFSNDIDRTEELKQFDNDEDHKLHLNVLPQPFFGNFDNPKVLFIANNPSYAKNDDEYDTMQYLLNNDYKLINYKTDLAKVNFLKSFSYDGNHWFYNTWKWWNKKVIGDLKIGESANLDNICFVNLCGYHSKYFKRKHYSEFPSCVIESLIDKADVVIFVWKETFDIFKKKIKDDEKPYLFLTKRKTWGNTNTLENILNNKCNDIYNDDLETKAIIYLKNVFIINER